jgi:signal transduction histidine kinase
MTPSLPASARATESQPPARGSTSVRRRMTFLLTITISAFTVAFFAVQQSLDAQLDVLVRDHLAETTKVLRRIVDLRASGAGIHADDYTRWDDFVTFTRTPDPKWAQLNITESIATFTLDVAWVLDDHYRLMYTANPGGDSAVAVLPVRPAVLATALSQAPVRHFFAATPRGMLEVWTSSVQPSSDFGRKTPPSGYYVVGRFWTAERIAELSALVDGDVTLALGEATHTRSSASSETGDIRIALPITDIRGSQIAVLDYKTTYAAAPRVHDALRMFLLLMIAGAALLFLGVSIVLTRWVTQPLALITDSLRTENPSPLYRLMARDDEFGRLARLVRDFFAQRGHLIEAREATEAASRAKQQFLANISHELRTPMHGIISFSRFGMVDAPAGPREELLDYFTQISSCGATLMSLLDDLLDLAKFDAGRMRMEFVELTLEEVAQEAVDEFWTVYEERKVALDFQSEPGLGPVRADRMRLRQVFRNLLSNAGKFTPAGGQVRMKIARAGAMVRVVVEDSGRGIPHGELELVFDRFSQASNNQSGAGGTGLGLPLCREIIQMHEGRIWAESRTPNGTRMIFEIRLAVPKANVSVRASGPESQDKAPGEAAA